jgi:hypothetical protein
MQDFFDSGAIAVASTEHGGDPQHWQKRVATHSYGDGEQAGEGVVVD